MDNQQERERSRIRYLLDHCAANDTVPVSESVPNYREIHTYATKWLRNSLDREEQLIAERDQWRSNFNELNQDGQEIQDHYKKVARTLWPGNDVPDIEKISVKFRELQAKVDEQDKVIQRLKELLVAANKDSWSEVIKRIDES